MDDPRFPLLAIAFVVGLMILVVFVAITQRASSSPSTRLDPLIYEILQRVVATSRTVESVKITSIGVTDGVTTASSETWVTQDRRHTRATDTTGLAISITEESDFTRIDLPIASHTLAARKSSWFSYGSITRRELVSPLYHFDFGTIGSARINSADNVEDERFWRLMGYLVQDRAEPAPRFELLIEKSTYYVRRLDLKYLVDERSVEITYLFSDFNAETEASQ